MERQKQTARSNLTRYLLIQSNTDDTIKKKQINSFLVV
ncbi:hypothetical protein CHCC20491_1800 [Bacillus paralicheniformis]|nr:hypothetical protein CHCC20491_1800 [Bacillus paralicheniformis]